MNAEEILKIYLKEHGFDGLCNEQCGCGVDDFAPCDGIQTYCEPAHRLTFPEGFEHDDCDDWAGEDIYVADVELWKKRIAEWKDAQS